MKKYGQCYQSALTQTQFQVGLINISITDSWFTTVMSEGSLTSPRCSIQHCRAIEHLSAPYFGSTTHNLAVIVPFHWSYIVQLQKDSDEPTVG